jgi:5-deoxy-D-glucuronate isomerase
LRFVSAAFYIGKGVAHKERKVVTSHGHRRTVTTTVYLPNATAKSASASENLSLTGIAAGDQQLRVVVRYDETVKTRGKTRTVVVTRTLSAKLNVC